MDVHIGALVDGLWSLRSAQLISTGNFYSIAPVHAPNTLHVVFPGEITYLMGESERQLDLIRGDVGITPPLERRPDGGRAHSEGSPHNMTRVHDE